MSCACQRTEPVPRCTGDLTIGIVSNLVANIYVYVRNIATGRIERYNSLTDGAGSFDLDMTEAGYFYDVHNSFELWTTLRSAPETRLTMTVNGDSDTCLLLTFEDHYNIGVIQDYLTYTLTT